MTDYNFSKNMNHIKIKYYYIWKLNEEYMYNIVSSFLDIQQFGNKGTELSAWKQ